MSHLTTERLAALADELPTADESAHLGSCAACADERTAFSALVTMAHAERGSLGLPLTRWESVAAALAADGAPDREIAIAPLVAASATSERRLEISHWARRSLRVAAALLLVAGGVVAGRASVAPSALQQQVADASDSASASFLTVEEARLAQQRSEQVYRQAVAYLAQHDSASPSDGNPVAYRSRLAALDQVISATRTAMRDAPHDPVINGYYLSTLDQREATLRQLNTVLPASLRLNSF